MRALKLSFLAILLSACGSWQPVVVTPNPASIADPVGEVRALLNLTKYPPAQVEVTPHYLKAIWIAGNAVGIRMLVFSRMAEVKVIQRSDIYQVSAYDAKGKEIWFWRPDTHDLPTCERMLNAIYALTRKAPPPSAAQPTGA